MQVLVAGNCIVHNFAQPGNLLHILPPQLISFWIYKQKSNKLFVVFKRLIINSMVNKRQPLQEIITSHVSLFSKG